ncbi:MAG: hypothetical protein SGBAC_007636 [Bacillariaceae sp.]
MPPKKKTKRAASKPQFAYVLTLFEYNHGFGNGVEQKVLGVYGSKEVAARDAGTLDTYTLGTFDDALHEYKFNYNGFVLDNRRNPPDDGILLQAGHKDEGEGDHIVLKITKLPFVTETTREIKPIGDNSDSE